MPSGKGRIISLFLFLLGSFLGASLLAPTLASAQCSPMLQPFQNIALVAGNPFLAEYSTTVNSTMVTTGPTTTHTGLASAARDSAGRVRVVRSAGKYKVKSADGTETEIERLNIWICDPATATFTVLDTGNKTATVTPPRANILRLIRPASNPGESFCTRLFTQRENRPNSQTQDLGHQLISGFDAVGIRIQFAPLSVAGTAPASSSYSELWCSDELGAVLQQSSGSESKSGRGFKNQSTMLDIQRTEPDATLFQIPADFTLLQREVDTARPSLLRPVPATPGPTNP